MTEVGNFIDNKMDPMDIHGRMFQINIENF
jgi:hypothetical protein